jgi:hypothetical protein
MSGFSIDSTSVVANLQMFQLNTATQSGMRGVDSDGDNDGSGGAGRARGGDGRAFMHSVFQTLSQLGLITPNQGSGSGTPAAQASADTGGAGANSSSLPSGDQSNVRHALHAFMHSLFHALRGTESAQATAGDSSAQGDGSASASPPDYTDVTSALQTLLQNVGSDSSGSSTQGNTGDLQTAFQNLVQALDAGGSTSSSAQPTLQSFLQALLQNLNGQSGSSDTASLNPTGNVVTTAA